MSATPNHQPATQDVPAAGPCAAAAAGLAAPRAPFGAARHAVPRVPAALRAVRTLGAAVGAATVLAACGPGLGGTGTGATVDAVAAYGAREVPVCQADFADLISCAPPATGAAPQPTPGPRFFAEATPASRVLLELDGQQAQLRLRCLDRVFVGTFAQAGSEPPRYYGTVIEGGSLTRLAALEVRRTAGGLTITLVEGAAPASAFGPQALNAVPGVTSAAACP